MNVRAWLVYILLFGCLFLVILTAALGRTNARAKNPGSTALGLYHPDPKHIWNRLYAHFCVRMAANGVEYGFDELDPLLWDQTEYLLTGASHQQALRLLDEFLRTHAERLIRDPLKRALLQRDLWAVFDWSARHENPHASGRRELQTRLALVLKRLAPAAAELNHLPDNYAQAVASRRFAAHYNPEHREAPFLPPDLFEPRGPWVLLAAAPLDPVARAHAFNFSGRSAFFVFLRLPSGRQATLDYLKKLWEFPKPWGSEGGFPDLLRTNPDLPQFPVGTQVALVRRMLLFDEAGALAATRLTESVQLRVYRQIPSHEPLLAGEARPTQDVYEFQLRRTRLFADDAGGLRAIAPGEKQFRVFQTHGWDVLTMQKPEIHHSVVLNSCIQCHLSSGIHSVLSRHALFPPNPQIVDSGRPDDRYGPLYWNAEAALTWKQKHFDWGLLKGLWQAASATTGK